MIEAMLNSIGEPQLPRCIEAIYNQTTPFSDFIHISNVVPASAALNKGIERVRDEWFMYLAGDIILYPNAVEIATNYILKWDNSKIFGMFFNLYDTFLRLPMGFISVLRTSCYKGEQALNTKGDDRAITRRLRRKGFKARKIKPILGSHFDKPDAFQVFRRFYFHGCKFEDNSDVYNRMQQLHSETEDPLYEIGCRAIDFAKVNDRYHPGSPNVDLAKVLFKDFKCYLYPYPSLLQFITATR